MRKSFLLINLLLFISLMGFSQSWQGINSDSPIAIKKSLVSSTEKEVVVDVQLGGFYTTNVTTPNGKQMIISVDDMVSMLEAQAPDLPLYAIPVIIGDQAEMKVSIVKSEYTDFEDVEIAPSKGNFSRQINPDDVPYTYGAMYQQDAFYPASQAYLEAPYILRDFRGQDIMVTPFAYNAVTKTLRVYHHLTIAVTKISENGVNQKLTHKSGTVKVDPEVRTAYENRFINYNQSKSRYTFIEDEGEMIVICPDRFMEAMQPYVNWKNISGRPTTMVSTTETGTSASAVKAYVQGVYDSNPNLTYILLVGDLADIAPNSMSGGRSDNFFGMLDGSDYYIEAFVGRFSVGSVADVETHVNKVLYYERDMPETVTWVNVGMGIGANEGAGNGHNGGEADYVHMDYIRDTLLHYTYETVTQQYSGVGSGTSAAAMSADFNNGVSIANYCNHGSQTSWAVGNFSNTHVDALTNDYMWPYIWSVACNNGQFDGTCFGEAWLRATNNSTGAPTGAIGGMFSWISQPWVPPMTGQDEMVDILTEWANDSYKHTLAGASLNGNMKVLDAHPSDNGETHNTWILFGDPSLMIRTDNPTSMNVSVNPGTLLIGMNELVVNAEADFAIATLSMNGEVLGSAYVVNGEAIITFDPVTNVGTAQLVVVGYNKVTHIQDIDVVPADGAYIVYANYELTDENQLMEYGETLGINVDVSNVGSDPANNITVTLATESEYVTVNNATANIASMAADETVTIADVFNVTVATDVPDGEKVEFVMTCVSGSDTWECPFKVIAHAPQFELVSVNPDNTFTPGGSANLVFEIKNVGSATANNTILEVFSSSSDIAFTNYSFDEGAVEAEATFTVEAELTVAEGVEIGSAYEIGFLAYAGHYSLQGTTYISVGNIVEDFETGDLTLYDWETTGDAQWSVVNTEAHSGLYSAKSGQMTDYQGCELQVTVDILAAGEVSFFYKVSSEANYDKLHFFIDNAEKDVWSGTIDWTQATYNITPGTHTFKWSYTKDVSQASGSDCAWVDDIQFPPTNVVSALDAITNLNASVNGNEVSLTWDAVEGATSYYVSREGEMISSQAETSFTETLEDGVYNYNIVAMNDAGLYSMPAYITVNVGTVSIDETQAIEFAVYPNPAINVLNIKGNVAEYHYSIINSLGQQVVEGMANGDQQIDMSSFSNGMYFLKIVANSEVKVIKIMVK